MNSSHICIHHYKYIGVNLRSKYFEISSYNFTRNPAGVLYPCRHQLAACM